MKAWKLDLWIALAALIVSGLTASAALYQSKVFSDQLSATVWPYISFDSTWTVGTGRSASSSFELTLQNDGAGPAIIEGAQLSLDGKPVPSMEGLIKPLALSLRGLGSSSYSSASIQPGLVIRSGDRALVARVAGRNLQKLRAVFPRVELRVYYCSLLNRCWVAKLHSDTLPQEVSGQSFPHTGIQ
jgi:hypothetical protein